MNDYYAAPIRIRSPKQPRTARQLSRWGSLIAGAAFAASWCAVIISAAADELRKRDEAADADRRTLDDLHQRTYEAQERAQRAEEQLETLLDASGDPSAPKPARGAKGATP